MLASMLFIFCGRVLHCFQLCSGGGRGEQTQGLLFRRAFLHFFWAWVRLLCPAQEQTFSLSAWPWRWRQYELWNTSNYSPVTEDFDLQQYCCENLKSCITQMYKQVSKYFIFTGIFGLAGRRGVALYANFALSSLLQQFLSTVSNEQVVS